MSVVPGGVIPVEIAPSDLGIIDRDDRFTVARSVIGIAGGSAVRMDHHDKSARCVIYEAVVHREGWRTGQKTGA